MKVLKNQTIYQCEYCGKRLLSQNGAKIHEEQYCWKSPIVKQNKLDEIMKCNHKWDTSYSYISGEAVMTPDYDYCIHCGVEKHKWHRMIEEVEVQ